ncbi:MAG: DUF760 domain-containing protein [Cyanobacteria bacterium]|nr:DUF760 domain-containing protein [Cyanobacteriota bacterium]MDA1020552.1 DUF760 domain-containing protein [Cyanobacteriota bacterium]
MDFGDRRINKQKFEVEMGPILKFFLERDTEELTKLADDLSEEAGEFFGGSLAALLGTMPEELGETMITTHKSALRQILYSAMVTGYITKTVEDKVKLERLWNDQEPKKEEPKSNVLFDSIVARPEFN